MIPQLHLEQSSSLLYIRTLVVGKLFVHVYISTLIHFYSTEKESRRDGALAWYLGRITNRKIDDGRLTLLMIGLLVLRVGLWEILKTGKIDWVPKC